MSKATKTYVIVGVVLAIVIVIAIKQGGSTPAEMDAGPANEMVGAQAQAPETAEAGPVAEAGADSAPETEMPAADQPTSVDPPVTADSKAQLPRFVEVGADSCIPCKMMQPVLDELRKAYSGRLEIEFADVWKNPDLGDKYQIRTIPTQVIYDAEGNEVFRHLGYWPKEEIDQKLKELGILD